MFFHSDWFGYLDCTSCNLNSGLARLLGFYATSLETFFDGLATLRKLVDKLLQSTVKFEAALQSCVLEVLAGTTRTLQVQQTASSQSFCRTIVQSGSTLL